MSCPDCSDTGWLRHAPSKLCNCTKGDELYRMRTYPSPEDQKLIVEEEKKRADAVPLEKVRRIARECFGAGMDEVNRATGAKEDPDEIIARVLGSGK